MAQGCPGEKGLWKNGETKVFAATRARAQMRGNRGRPRKPTRCTRAAWVKKRKSSAAENAIARDVGHPRSSQKSSFQLRIQNLTTFRHQIRTKYGIGFEFSYLI